MRENKDLRSRRVAVTGATGMIGSHLLAEMVKAGYTDIIVPVRNKARMENVARTFGFMGMEMPEGIFTIVETELKNTALLTDIFKDVDTVFHCAAVIMAGNLTEQQLIENNVSLARSVADAAVTAGVKKIMHTSSIIELCPPGHSHYVTEDDPPQIHEGSSAYGKSKYYCSVEMQRAEKRGVEIVKLCPAVVLGEGDWSFEGSSAIVTLMAGRIPFYSNGVMAYVDVRDVARAFVMLDSIPEAVGKTFIISADNLSYKELITYGREASGRKKPVFRVGRGLIYTGYGIMKGLTAMGLVKNRGITKGNVNSILYGNRYCGEKICEFCEFSYTPIRETIDRVVGNYMSR